MRVVSLTCSNTEIVCALGCAEFLVGVDDHSDFPAEVVASLPRVGPDLGVDPEKVLALEPDLVLASLTVPGHEKVVATIDATGLPYVAPQPQSLGDVARDVREISALLGVPERGERVALEMERELAQIGTRSRGSSRRSASGGSDEPSWRPSILIQWWPKPVIAPGRRSWAHDLLELVGATHPLAREDVESRPVEDSEVAAAAPDAIVVSWCGVEPEKVRPDVVRRNPAFGEVPAIVHDQIFCIPEALLGRPSPRLVEGARALCHVADSAVSVKGGRTQPPPLECQSRR